MTSERCSVKQYLRGELPNSATMTEERVHATETSIRLLEGIAELGGEAGITELADHCSVAKSTVFKHLATLEDNGLVVHHGEKYRIGLRSLEFGGYAQRYDGIYETARPEVRRMAEETGELANVMFEEQGKGVYVFTARGDRAVDIDTHVGRRAYLHSTGLGKAILASLPDTRVEEIIETHGLPRQTEHTITDSDELFRALEAIRETGIAHDREEGVVGMGCVACSLSTPGNRAAAISITGPVSRILAGDNQNRLHSIIERAANVIELNLTNRRM